MPRAHACALLPLALLARAAGEEDNAGNATCSRFGAFGAIYLNPQWGNVGHVSNGDSIVNGMITLELDYQPFAINGDRDQDMRDAVVFENFLGGASGRVKTERWVWESGLNRVRESITFVGGFLQAFDGTCFPFDTQTLTFRMSLPLATWAADTGLALYCPLAAPGGPACTAFDGQGGEISYSDPLHENSTVYWLYGDEAYAHRIVMPINKAAQGFTWGSMDCSLVETPAAADPSCALLNAVECTLDAKRNGANDFKVHLLPGLYLVLLGYASFAAPPSLAMPRVAITMISVLTFLDKMTKALTDTPTHGATSIVQQFYEIGACCVVVNVLGHIFAFSHPDWAEVTDAVMGTFTFSSVFVVFTVLLHARRCEQIDPAVSASLVVVCAALWVASTSALMFRYRKHLLGLRARASATDEVHI